MSDIRIIALQEAIKLFAHPNRTGDVVNTAESFLNFLQGADKQPAQSEAPVKPAKSPKQSKPAKSEEQLVAEAAERIAKTEAEAEVSTSATKEAVGKAVEAMLKANKRKEAVALLAKLGATSVSSLAESNYAAFIEEADAVLMSA